MNKILFLAFACFILTVSSAPVEDLVQSLPNFTYTASSLYSGYLDIEGEAGKKLHYLFVEAEQNTDKTPLVLWLNGGPGCSSLLGFGDENGIFYFEEGGVNLFKNEYSWNKKANMIYLESPAGVGFSIAKTDKDYDTSDVKSGIENLKALLSFFKKFPEHLKRDFYISGESYAGIYIPYLANNILDYNLSTANKINLKGLLIGNGVTDWNVDTQNAIIDFAYEHSLYSYEIRQQVLQKCFPKKDTPECIAVSNKIQDSISDVNIYDIYRTCYHHKANSLNSGKELKYPYTPWLSKGLQSFTSRDLERITLRNQKEEALRFLSEPTKNPVLKDLPPCTDGIGAMNYYNLDAVKDALHVDKSIKWEMCNDKFQKSYFVGDKASFWIYPNLIQNKLKIWKFSGDTDMAVPFNGTRAWIHNLNLPIVKEDRKWFVNDQVAGYVTEFQGLTYITVKGVGHMVPQWKRAEAFHMFESFLNGNDI